MRGCSSACCRLPAFTRQGCHYRLGLGVILLTVLLLAPAGCSPDYRVSENAPMVRVRILENQEQVLVAASAAPVMTSTGDNTPRQLNLPGGNGVPVTLSPGGWHVGNVTIASGSLTIQPPSVGSVRVNGQAYRGRYRFVPVTGNRFDVINDVDIDSYLMSVLPRELLSKWQLETYKARRLRRERTHCTRRTRPAPAGRMTLRMMSEARCMADYPTKPPSAAAPWSRLPALSWRGDPRGRRRYSRRTSVPAAAGWDKAPTMRSAMPTFRRFAQVRRQSVQRLATVQLGACRAEQAGIDQANSRREFIDGVQRRTSAR